MGIFFVRPFGGSHLASKFMPKGCISIYLTHTKNHFSLKMPIYIRLSDKRSFMLLKPFGILKKWLHCIRGVSELYDLLAEYECKSCQKDL